MNDVFFWIVLILTYVVSCVILARLLFGGKKKCMIKDEIKVLDAIVENKRLKAQLAMIKTVKLNDEAIQWQAIARKLAERLAVFAHNPDEYPEDSFCATECKAYKSDPICDCCQDASEKYNKCTNNLLTWARKEVTGVNHGKLVCSFCGKIISQCRCIAGCNDINYTICKKCKDKPKQMIETQKEGE